MSISLRNYQSDAQPRQQYSTELQKNEGIGDSGQGVGAWSHGRTHAQSYPVIHRLDVLTPLRACETVNSASP